MQYLNERKTRDLTNELNRYFEKRVAIPRMRRGRNQEIETLINEEALLLTMFLRRERQSWKARIAELPN